MSSTHKHYDCPRCDESIFFDVDAQICDRCEWGLDEDTTPTNSDADVEFSTTLDTDDDCQNAAHTLLSKLKQLKADTPNETISVSVEVTELTSHPSDES